MKTTSASGRTTKRFAKTFDELPGGALEQYWTKAIPDLLNAYDRVCSFCCFRIHPASGTPSVDHMAPKSRAWNAVYEWTNYRLAALRMNARKGKVVGIIDPFEVQPGWFALELTFGQVIPGPATVGDPALRARIQHTIDALRLNTFWEERLRDIVAYADGNVSLRRLQEESPFVAHELVRQGRLHAWDAP